MRCVAASPGLSHDDNGDAEQPHESAHLDGDVDDDDVRGGGGDPRRERGGPVAVPPVVQRRPVEQTAGRRVGVRGQAPRRAIVRERDHGMPVGVQGRVGQPAPEEGDRSAAPRERTSDRPCPGRVTAAGMVDVIPDAGTAG